MYFKRNKGKYTSDIKFDNIYKMYKKDVKNYLDKKLFKSIWREYAEKVINLMIMESYELVLGSHMGTISIRQRKAKLRLEEDGSLRKKDLFVNWESTKKLWEEMYPGLSAEEIKAIPNKKLVYHTDKVKVFWKWDKRTCNVLNNSYYKFIAARWAVDSIPKAIKEENVTFYEYR
jgi:hypothetical protein